MNCDQCFDGYVKFRGPRMGKPCTCEAGHLRAKEHAEEVLIGLAHAKSQLRYHDDHHSADFVSLAIIIIRERVECSAQDGEAKREELQWT